MKWFWEKRLINSAFYNEYKEAQIATNKRKFSHEYTWVSDQELRKIADYLKQNIPAVQFGICHGGRNGREVLQLRKYLAIDVIGTDIASTAEELPHVIVWDFHEVKPEWVDAVDFIYSNSFDHTYDPYYCLKQWMSCIKPGGMCLLHFFAPHMDKSTKFDGADCFGASNKELKQLIKQSYELAGKLDLGSQRFCYVVKHKGS